MDNKLSRIQFLRLFGAGALGITPLGRSLLSIAADPPVLTTIVVTPATANLVVGGPSATFVAEGKDQYNNTHPISNPEWTTCGGGTLAPNGTSCTYTATAAGSHTIECRQAGTNIRGSSFIHTTSSPVLTTIVITPATANLVVGGPNATFVAEGKDQYNNTYPISSPVWTTSGGGTLSPSGTYCAYRATAAGTFILTCAQGGTAVKGTATIHATNPSPVLTTIVITPATANLMVGGPSATFVAEGKDQYNNTYPISSPVWTTSGGGTILPSGTSCRYSPAEKGRHTITCRQNGTTIQGTANIHTGHHIYLSMVSG